MRHRRIELFLFTRNTEINIFQLTIIDNMDKLRFKNYRCFEDTGDISLKPLTFLLGANSSGKSSILEFFPLLKQSVGIRKNGLFLWYSSDVDFKDFTNTVRNGKGSIELTLKYDNFAVNERRRRGARRRVDNDWQKMNDTIGITLTLRISAKKDSSDYLEYMKIEYLDEVIEIDIDKTNHAKPIINGRLIAFEQKMMRITSSGLLLPNILFPHPVEEGLVLSMYPRFLEEMDPFSDKMPQEIKDRFFYDDVFFLRKDENVEYLKSIVKQDDVDYEYLRDIYILSNINEIIDMLNNRISAETMAMSYIKPLRVMTERYYRYQNYAVDDIDSDGKNLAMFFANLTDMEFNKFREWTDNNFGFKIYISKHEGHVELRIGDDEESSKNLVDVGFGYTQLLPIITIIWKSIFGRGSRQLFSNSMIVTKIIAIEQPELHLHPRIQSSFGVMLANLIANMQKDNDIRFVIETHSEAIINAIGSMVQSERLSQDKVNVVIFNGEEEGLDQYVVESQFDNNGYLSNWPVGFFM